MVSHTSTPAPHKATQTHHTTRMGRMGLGGAAVFPVQSAVVAAVPGINGAQRATGFIRAVDIPDLTAFMKINPRAPKPSGSVPKAIIETLTKHPELMVLKNAGLYILANKVTESDGALLVDLKDPFKHGLVNGGHTLAMIRQVQEHGTPEDQTQLAKAYVPIQIFTSIPDENIVDMASGLNHTRQVTEASLEHLRGHYDTIKAVMDKELGGDQIAYFEGDTGTIPIGDVLAFVETFNLDRYPITENPYGLYAHRARVIDEASEDFSLRSNAINLVITRLPDILRLVNTIQRDIQALRPGVTVKRLAKTPEQGGTAGKVLLPFLGERVQEKLPNGWLYPILASFRVNVHWDLKAKRFSWKEPNVALLKAAAGELVAICMAEQRNSGNKPEWVGKRESAYRQCKLQMELILQKRTK